MGKNKNKLFQVLLGLLVLIAGYVNALTDLEKNLLAGGVAWLVAIILLVIIFFVVRHILKRYGKCNYCTGRDEEETSALNEESESSENDEYTR